uniref:Chromo domain-containing protein n=1 Tax=Rhabditophanes sp. KR3021 TaxID=114890 RepID=A0AC35TFK6_9BILA
MGDADDYAPQMDYMSMENNGQNTPINSMYSQQHHQQHMGYPTPNHVPIMQQQQPIHHQQPPIPAPPKVKKTRKKAEKGGAILANNVPQPLPPSFPMQGMGQGHRGPPVGQNWNNGYPGNGPYNQQRPPQYPNQGPPPANNAYPVPSPAYPHQHSNPQMMPVAPPNQAPYYGQQPPQNPYYNQPQQTYPPQNAVPTAYNYPEVTPPTPYYLNQGITQPQQQTPPNYYGNGPAMMVQNNIQTDWQQQPNPQQSAPQPSPHLRYPSQPSASAAPAPPPPAQPQTQSMVYQLQAEARDLDSKLQILYNSPPSNEGTTQIHHLMQRLNLIRSQMGLTNPLPVHQPHQQHQQNNYNQTLNPGHHPTQQPSLPPQNHHEGKNVALMQTEANQVQVNITPSENSGKMLISVYHQYQQKSGNSQAKVNNHQNGYPPCSSSNSSIGSACSKESLVPPEPTPSTNNSYDRKPRSVQQYREDVVEEEGEEVKEEFRREVTPGYDPLAKNTKPIQEIEEEQDKDEKEKEEVVEDEVEKEELEDVKVVKTEDTFEEPFVAEEDLSNSMDVDEAPVNEVPEVKPSPFLTPLTAVEKPKKKGASKGRKGPPTPKTSASRKKRKNVWEGEEEDDDAYYVSESARKKKAKRPKVSSSELSNLDSLPDDLIEKRRSGRKGGEKNYIEHKIEQDEDLMEPVENVEAVEIVKAEVLWIVEKVLSHRMGKRVEVILEKKVQEDVGKEVEEVVASIEDQVIKMEAIGDTCEDITTHNSIAENPIADDSIADDSIAEDSIAQNSVSKEPTLEQVAPVMPTEEIEVEEFFVKYKQKSYIHCKWQTLEELELDDKRVENKLKRYKQKLADAPFQNFDEDLFNADYVIVERVVDMFVVEDEMHYFCKWRQLSYDECTWELIENVPSKAIEEYHARNKVDPLKKVDKAKPTQGEWTRLPEDKMYKDGNTLREYQYEGVNWLTYCYFNQRNCMLADEMGLGKTVQSITFLQEVYDYGIRGPFLIVVPLSTLHNWEREFETWTDMNVIVYHGAAKSREIVQQYEFYYSDEMNKAKRNIVKFDVLITTFEMVVSDCEILKKIPYRICIIDEAHRLKNRNCKLIQGGFSAIRMEHRVLLTGTPLQNNIQELFSLLNFLEPTQFSSSGSFLEQFGDCQTEEQVQKIQDILKPMMLRRLKEDVEKTLKPKEEVIIEVQLSSIQKKYYRAILEKNFTHLCKGTSQPSLMNIAMELRKCCNHPFLVNSAEDNILNEMRVTSKHLSEEEIQFQALIQSSGKLVLCDKLLPKLRSDGNKVLIFSQMVKVLDLLEEYLIHKSYPFERIDGNIRGDMRQAAIDRFQKKDSDKFVFLLCTRAGGLGINLTAADTVIIFDSDFNPQADRQSIARSHRIGQKKVVKIYRLITTNTYEREMFEKANLKLGLDKAVLQSLNPKDNNPQMSRKEVEDLLKKGAYGSIMDDESEENKFNEEDIDTILSRRTQTILIDGGVKGSTFSKATFSSSTSDDIDINDPLFWAKWADKAQIDTEIAKESDLIIDEPRNRRKRFEGNVYKNKDTTQDSDEDATSKDGSRSGGNNDRNKRTSKRKRGTEDVEDCSSFLPDELNFNKQDYFKVEKLLNCWGWGRWDLVKKNTDLQLSENEIEHIARTLLLHCVREFRGDEKVREFIWRIIIPKEVDPEKELKSGPEGYSTGWAASPEYNPPALALDGGFQRHIHRHANRLLQRVYYLYLLSKFMINEKSEQLMDLSKSFEDIELAIPQIIDPVNENWNGDADKCLLIGIFRHGMENYDLIKADPTLLFATKNLEIPTTQELNARFKKLLIHFQKSLEAALLQQQQAHMFKAYKWPKNEEADFMRVLRIYGVKDSQTASVIIDWGRFKELSSCLHNKTDADMLEHLYCVLALCSKLQGAEIQAADVKRATMVDQIDLKKASALMNRLHLLRKIHAIVVAGFDKSKQLLDLCQFDGMPQGWARNHDYEVLKVAHNHGIDNLHTNCLEIDDFKDIVVEEKTLLKRLIDICSTVETGACNLNGDLSLLDDSEEPAKAPELKPKAKSRRKETVKASASPHPASTTAANDSDMNEQEKMRNLMHQNFVQKMDQSFLQKMDQNSLAALSMMAQAQMMQQAVTTSSGSSSSSMNATAMAYQQAQLQQLMTLAALSNAGQIPANMLQGLMAQMVGAQTSAAQQASTSSSTPSTSKAKPGPSSEEALNLSKKEKDAKTPAANNDASSLSELSFQELLALANLPPDTKIPVVHKENDSKLTMAQSPMLKHLEEWLKGNSSYKVDVATLATSKMSNSLVTGSTPKQGEAKPKLVDNKHDNKHDNTPINVFHKSSGQNVDKDNCPPLKNLAAWLDKHPDFNVHSSQSTIVKTKLPKMYFDRIGGENAGMSSIEALQMQMLLQSSQMMNPLMGGYNPYGALMQGSGMMSDQATMLALAAAQYQAAAQAASGKGWSGVGGTGKATTPATSSAGGSTSKSSGSASAKEAQQLQELFSNPQVLQAMMGGGASNGMQMQQLQQLLQLESLNAQIQAANKAQAAATSTAAGNQALASLVAQFQQGAASASAQSSNPGTPQSSSSGSLKKKSKLNAVVDKLTPKE